MEDELPGRGSPLGVVAAQHDPDPRHQLLDAERLGHVVVAADGQPVDLLLGGVASGQEDHRDLDAIADQALHDREAVVVREPNVEDHEVGPEVHHRVSCLLCGGGGLNGEALVFERHRHQIGDGTLVIDDEDTVRLGRVHGGHSTIFARNSGKTLRTCWIYPAFCSVSRFRARSSVPSGSERQRTPPPALRNSPMGSAVVV